MCLPRRLTAPRLQELRKSQAELAVLEGAVDSLRVRVSGTGKCLGCTSAGRAAGNRGQPLHSVRQLTSTECVWLPACLPARACCPLLTCDACMLRRRTLLPARRSWPCRRRRPPSWGHMCLLQSRRGRRQTGMCSSSSGWATRCCPGMRAAWAGRPALQRAVAAGPHSGSGQGAGWPELQWASTPRAVRSKQWQGML